MNKFNSGLVCFIDNLIILNKQLNHKKYAMSKINENLLKLEGFKYATSLYFKMVYYHTQPI